MLQSRDDRHHELQDDLSRNVRINPHRQHGEIGHRPAGQKVEQVEERRSSPGTAQDAGDGLPIDPGDRHVRCETVDHEQSDRDQQPVADVL